MGQLKSSGLFELQPGFRNGHGRQRWARKVLKLLGPFKSPRQPQATSKAEVWKAIHMAVDCFGFRWAMTFAIMLLGL